MVGQKRKFVKYDQDGSGSFTPSEQSSLNNDSDRNSDVGAEQPQGKIYDTAEGKEYLKTICGVDI